MNAVNIPVVIIFKKMVSHHLKTARKFANAGLLLASFRAVSMALEKFFTKSLYASKTVDFEN